MSFFHLGGIYDRYNWNDRYWEWETIQSGCLSVASEGKRTESFICSQSSVTAWEV